MNTLEYRIKAARKHANYTQIALSELIGMSSRTFKTYEKDASKITVRTVKLIAHHCKVSEVWLFTGQGNMYPKPTNYDTTGNSSESMDVLDIKDIALREHYEVIRRFRDNEEAKEINEDLVELEHYSYPDYQDMKKQINIVTNTVKKQVKRGVDLNQNEQTSKQQGLGVGKERRKKA